MHADKDKSLTCMSVPGMHESGCIYAHREGCMHMLMYVFGYLCRQTYMSMYMYVCVHVYQISTPMSLYTYFTYHTANESHSHYTKWAYRHNIFAYICFTQPSATSTSLPIEI